MPLTWRHSVGAGRAHRLTEVAWSLRQSFSIPRNDKPTKDIHDMGARKAAMKRKALKLILPGYDITFRDLMRSYRFWQRVIKVNRAFKTIDAVREMEGYGKENR